jgi:hypothetical protein
MRRILFASVFLVLAGMGAPGEAQAQLLRFGIGAGPSIPMGDLGDAVNTGFHAQGMVALRVPLLPLSLRGDVLFQRFSADAPGVGNFQQIAGVVNGFYTLLPVPMVSPYVSGGVGLYNSSFGGGDSSTDFGVNVGAGLRVNLLLVEVFGEARLHNVFGEGDSQRTLPVTVGVMF